MIIKNEKLIAVIILVSGIAIAAFNMWNFYNYSYTAITGIKATAHIISYKRIKGAGKLHPAFSFTMPDGRQVNGVSKTLAFKLLRKSYSINEEITVSYKADDPSGAVIMSWREWPCSLFVTAFGILVFYIGWQMLWEKAKNAIKNQRV